MVELTVADSGEGILPQDLPHVFEPFFSTRPDGGGLGLALAHRIAQEHDGEVTVRSERGSGAEFTLHLPACHA
jgi:two-component system sensor histidine kinase AtoS